MHEGNLRWAAIRASASMVRGNQCLFPRSEEAMSTDARNARTFAIAAVIIGILSVSAHYWFFVKDLPVKSAAALPATRI
jgi:hypothetical protein